MSDHLISLVRTYVPIWVGALLTWLAATLGVGLDEGSSTALTAGVTALVAAVYYAAARALEARWPVLGILLGHWSAPEYGHPPAQTKSQALYDAAGHLLSTNSTTTWPRRE